MPIVLGSFTSSSTKFVDLSYYAQSCSDSMKALQPLLPRMHDEAHQLATPENTITYHNAF